jgi:hypothetical protein
MKFNNLLFAASLLSMAGSLVCCAKEPPPTPFYATAIEGNTIVISAVDDIQSGVSFDRVRAGVTGADWQVIDVVEAAYSSGRAVLTLPGEFSTGQLMKAGRANAGDYTGFWPASVDDPDARVAGLGDIYAYMDEERVGRIFLSDRPVGTSFVYYQYADRPFSLTGYNFVRPGRQRSFRYEA